MWILSVRNSQRVWCWTLRGAKTGLTVTGAPGSPQSRFQGRAGLLGKATACSAEDGAERGGPEPTDGQDDTCSAEEGAERGGPEPTVRATPAAPGGQAQVARPRCRRCGCGACGPGAGRAPPPSSCHPDPSARGELAWAASRCMDPLGLDKSAGASGRHGKGSRVHVGLVLTSFPAKR